ncbi:MAG: branched-chain amino acid ABC transporter permease [Acidimicrobiia bacterium]|nr:MAG: branched-chain amino acid ABC transporter permease [Acidimicrobiia bacterium]
MSGKYVNDYRQDLRLFRTTPKKVLLVVGLLAAIALPYLIQIQWTPPFGFPWKAWAKAINLALIWSIGAAAFNLLLGYTGQISTAHAAFLILGALTGAVLGEASAGLGWSFWLVLPLGGVVGAVIGALVGLPALRVRGLYLFMATLAVHFAAILGFKMYQVAQVGFTGVRYFPPEVPSFLHWLPFVTPDANGQFLIQGDFRWYFVLVPITLGCLLFMVNVLRSAEGRAFVAIRDNDVAASLLGINVARTKLLAFAVSSAMVTISGVLLSFFVTARSDESWSIEIILDVAIMTVVGGFSTIVGGVFGAFFFFMTPVLFNWIRDLPLFDRFTFIDTYGSQIDLAIFGVAIVLVLVFKPEGLAGVWEDTKRYFRTWPFRY